MIPFLIAIPKAGTHMIKQTTYRRGSNIPYGSMIFESDPHPVSINDIKNADNIGISHLPYHPSYELTLKKKGAKVVFLYRDPRDLMISYYFWIKKLGHKGQSIPGLINDVSTILNSDDPFSVMIPFWGMHIRRYLPWMFAPDILCMSYEKLVQQPEPSFTKLAEFWDGRFGTGKQMLNKLRPHKCETFRKGIVGDWKNHLTAEHLSMFDAELGREMEFMGYI